MKLSIIIPAYNEEQSIGSTLERCLAARREIVGDGIVKDMEIIVVSDGSTDDTAKIARGFKDVRLIEFERNRGYGAAIKKGFDVATGELLAFLDADGTCDPRFFKALCRAVVAQGASVAIGSRLGPDSRMPRIRRLGNHLYAALLSLLSNRVVTDTASGMRVIRRNVLRLLYPLPDGLDFTPAMSARILMDDRLSIVEEPMSYSEREGRSKLRVLHDGARFLHTILHMSLMWQPTRVFVAGAITCFALMALLAMHPVETWWRSGIVREDMIYRFLFCSLLGTVGVMLLSFGVLCENLHRLLVSSRASRSFLMAVLNGVYTNRGLLTAGAPAMLLAVWLVGPGWWTRLVGGYVELHWSRVVLAGLIGVTLAAHATTTLVANIIRFHAARAPVGNAASVGDPAEKPACTMDAGVSPATHAGSPDHPLPSLLS